MPPPQALHLKPECKEYIQEEKEGGTHTVRALRVVWRRVAVARHAALASLSAAAVLYNPCSVDGGTVCVQGAPAFVL